MAQHFFPFSLMPVDEPLRHRWNDGGRCPFEIPRDTSGGERWKPICRECGWTEVWKIREDRRWKCSEKACRAQFSVTSHNGFKECKLSFRKMLAACTPVCVWRKGCRSVSLLPRDPSQLQDRLHKCSELVAAIRFRSLRRFVFASQPAIIMDTRTIEKIYPMSKFLSDWHFRHVFALYKN